VSIFSIFSQARMKFFKEKTGKKKAQNQAPDKGSGVL